MKERKQFETADLGGAGQMTTVWEGQRQKNMPTTAHLTKSESMGLAPEPCSPTSGSQKSICEITGNMQFQKLTDVFKPPKCYNDKPMGKLQRN